MQVIRREFENPTRGDVFRIIPIGDVHIGAAACDEALLKSIVKNIAKDKRAYWIGMGDYCEFINVADKRFDADTLADWITTPDFVDLAKVQKERFVDAVRPIASKCLGLLEGNHEHTIRARTERDIYREIVAEIKGEGKLGMDTRLALGFYGWLQLAFIRPEEKRRTRCIINFNLHHGFVGGKLAGGKALNMQRWLWTHNADICLWGHSHNTGIQPEAVEEIDHAGNVKIVTRRGAFSGTFLKTINEDGPSTYSEIRGYFPIPNNGVMVELRPGARHARGRIRMIYEG